MRPRPSIQLASGKFFSFTNYTARDIEITDIAHHLANLCRFTGACREFYSVAQHSVIVSRIVPPEHALAGLLHDATEAYLNDLSRSVKRLVGLRGYRKLENEVWSVIAQRYNLPVKLPACIKEADNIAVVTEGRDLMPKVRGTRPGWEGLEDIRPLPEKIHPEDPSTARTKFLLRYRYLLKQRAKREAATALAHY
jgi:hypothetical protein